MHQTLKYPTPNGVKVVRGEQKNSQECYAAALKGSVVCVKTEKADLHETLYPEHGLPVEKLKFLPLLTLGRQVSINTKLGTTEREEVIKFL